MIVPGGARAARADRLLQTDRKEDIHVQWMHVTPTATSPPVMESVNNGASLVGGTHGQFGSTLGIIYHLFDFRSGRSHFDTA